MFSKRIVIVSGHYGSGKTNLAVNFAIGAAKNGGRVVLADMDIVNPYYRSLDSAQQLKAAGVGLICSGFANSNLDVPSIPKELYAVTVDKDARFVLDVGGDDRGALALGRLAGDIVSENDYDMLAVVNCYRPLTHSAAATVAVLREIEAACAIPFTAIVNNSNLGAETTAQSVLDSVPYANEVASLMGLPLSLTCVNRPLYDELKQTLANPFALSLQKKV